MSEMVYADPLLLKGEALFVVHRVDGKWILQSRFPETGAIEQYEQIEKEKALELYPVLSQLFDADITEAEPFFRRLYGEKWI